MSFGNMPLEYAYKVNGKMWNCPCVSVPEEKTQGSECLISGRAGDIL